MNKRMAASATLLLATVITDSQVDPKPPVQPTQEAEQAEVVDKRDRVTEIVKEAFARQQFFLDTLKSETPEPLILKQDEKIRRQLAFVNTQAISCGYWKNKLCIELEAQGIPVAHLKSSMQDSAHLFSDDLRSLESYEAFEARIVALLQPVKITESLSYEQRLDNATEILARSSLGVYQILYRYNASFLKQSFQGESGRKNMFQLISSKEKQDKLVEIVIRDLGARYGWNVLLMAAEYYGGPKLAIPLSKKLAGSTEYDKLLNGRRYHGYSSVMAYIASFESDIAQFAVNEELDPGDLSMENKIRFIRYAIAKAEGSFDMQSFERNKK